MNKVGKDTHARKIFRLLRACSRFQKPTHISGKDLCRNGDKPMGAACARYSLVKGERIVRSALTTRLIPSAGMD